jgi:hypothetical protein
LFLRSTQCNPPTQEPEKLSREMEAASGISIFTDCGASL